MKIKFRFAALTCFIISMSLVSCSKTDTPGPGQGQEATVSFTRKVYVEDFTGAWCGWCPLMAWNLDSMRNSNPRVIFAAVHDDVGNPGNDPYSSSYTDGLENLVPNFGGFPTAFVNRKTTTDQFNVTQSVSSALAKKATAGLQIETTISGNKLTAKVTTGFAADYSGSNIKLAIMLVEDDLLSTQHNYYFHTNYVPTSSPLWQNQDLFNWKNNGVLRSYATSIDGDAIPQNATTIDNESYSKSVDFFPANYNIANCRVIAMIILASGSATEVLNVQDVKAGESQLFD